MKSKNKRFSLKFSLIFCQKLSEKQKETKKKIFIQILSYRYAIGCDTKTLTRTPELFCNPWVWAPLGPGPGTMYPLNTPLVGSTTFRRTHFGADLFGTNIWCFLLTLTQSPNPKKWTVKEHQIGAETICAENVQQGNRWRRNGRPKMVAPKRHDPPLVGPDLTYLILK